MKIYELNKINAYVIATEYAEEIWNIVIDWQNFPKYSIGTQFTEAADSISANIAESQGRHHKKDKINFYRYARGSAYECIDWMAKSYRRKLMSKNKYDELSIKLENIIKEINTLIILANKNLKY